MLQHLLRKNHILNGVLAGLIFPLAGYVLLSSFLEILDETGFTGGMNLSENFRLRTTAVIAICLNLIPLRSFNRGRQMESIRGVVLVTFAMGVSWFFLFKHEFLPV